MVRPAGCAVPEAAGLAPVAAAMSPLTPAAVAGSRQEGEYLAEQVPSLGVAGAEDGKLGKPTQGSSSDSGWGYTSMAALPPWGYVRVRLGSPGAPHVACGGRAARSPSWLGLGLGRGLGLGLD